MKKTALTLFALMAAGTAHAGDFDDVTGYLQQKADDTQQFISDHDPTDAVKQNATQVEEQRDTTGDINPANHVNVGQSQR